MSKRSQWKLLAIAVVLGVVGWCLGVRKRFGRKVFVSNVDIATGYRCRFTIPSAWERRSEERRVGKV